MDKEYEELEEFLEVIVTTAKLMGYKVNQAGKSTIFWDRYAAQKAFVVKKKIFLHKDEQITLIINSDDLSTQTHATKLLYLQEELEKL